MRAKTVKVGRLKAGPGKYENERIEIEIEIPKGKTAQQAVDAARGFLAKQFNETPSDDEVEAAKDLLAKAKRVPSL
jgi:hypothetical protein